MRLGNRRDSGIAAVRIVVCAAISMTACDRGRPHRLVAGGDAERGRDRIVAYGCGSCHTIPGIRTAHGMVGPPLAQFARRSYIAGELPNSANHLVRWISSPQSVEPGTAMPDLGVTVADARDIAAYLYTLR
jgi:cytochrome c2